jgi:hypothetical protein
MPKTKKQQATELLSQMVEVSELLDSKQDNENHASDGESWMTFHLKALKDLLEEMD